MSIKVIGCYLSPVENRAGAGDRTKISHIPAVMSAAKVTGGDSPDSEKHGRRPEGRKER